jgi:hypothetical protein
MTRGKRGEPESWREQARPVAAVKVGSVLLELRDVLRRAEKCRQTLCAVGYSRKQWQDLVNSVAPELRFIVRPQILDVIKIYLRSVGEPVSRETLVNEVNAQGAGSIQRIRSCVTTGLRSRSLTLFPGNKIGLPKWAGKG